MFQNKPLIRQKNIDASHKQKAADETGGPFDQSISALSIQPATGAFVAQGTSVILRRFSKSCPQACRDRQLVEDVGNYITNLPKAEHAAPEWQDAMEVPMLVGARASPTMLARIGFM